MVQPLNAVPRPRALLGALAALAVLALLALVNPVAAHAGCRLTSLTYNPNASPVCERYRYALETIRLPYNVYVARANDFRASGCERRAAQRSPGSCSKPSPYDDFDWTTDGCSPRLVASKPWLTTPAQAVFNRACQEHDFGYRNFGKGLTLGRNESQRAWIDKKFLAEMRKMCRDPRVFGVFPGVTPLASYQTCRLVAYGFYAAVRNLSDWSE